MHYVFFSAAIALDGGLDVVDRIFGAVLFGNNEQIHRVWIKIPPHPLQVEHPEGDREWVSKVPMLQVSFLIYKLSSCNYSVCRLMPGLLRFFIWSFSFNAFMSVC